MQVSSSKEDPQNGAPKGDKVTGMSPLLERSFPETEGRARHPPGPHRDPRGPGSPLRGLWDTRPSVKSPVRRRSATCLLRASLTRGFIVLDKMPRLVLTMEKSGKRRQEQMSFLARPQPGSRGHRTSIRVGLSCASKLSIQNFPSEEGALQP